MLLLNLWLAAAILQTKYAEYVLMFVMLVVKNASNMLIWNIASVVHKLALPVPKNAGKWFTSLYKRFQNTRHHNTK
jgi:hypothetical protein